MGNAVHAALREWFDLDVDRRTPSDAARLVRGAWSGDGFLDDAQSEHWCEEAAAMTVRYLDQQRPAQPWGRERSLGTLGDHVVVSGRIDRLDERPGAGETGELVVVDYKTGRTVPTDDDARVSRPLALYALMVQRSLRRPAFTVELHHVPSGRVATHRHTPDSLARQLGRVDAIGRDMKDAELAGRDEDFAPTVGPLCSWCGFRDRCPEAGAYPAKPRWAGLPVAEG